MDIKKIGGELFTTGVMKQGKGAEPGGMGFKELFETARSNRTEVTQTSSSAPAAGTAEIFTNSIFPPSLLQSPSPSIRSQGVQAAEKTLDLLEDYQKKIANSQIPLKKIDGLLQSLSKELQGVRELSEKVPPSDPLQKILSEIGIVSAVEIEKFNRGDYL